MTVLLKNGTEVVDPRLDRLVQFDEQSRSFGIMEVVDARKFRSYTWRCDLLLNQGREGACVGNALTHELAARPGVVTGLTQDFATRTYYEAQRTDPWDGGEYPGAYPRYGGTSVLAGVKVLHKQGWFKSYRWAFGLDQLRKGVAYNGPAVIGIDWYDSMYDPDSDGFIAPGGRKVGGHAILVRGVSEKRKLFRLRNSWGIWGIKGSGDCFMTFDNMDKLLNQRGEAVFLQGRQIKPLKLAA